MKESIRHEVISGHYTAADGSTLCFRHWPAERADVYSPVVFLHSLFFDGSMFDAIACRIGSRHDRYALDHRGQGASPSGDIPLTMSQLARDTAEFIESKVGQPVHLVGSSMGGYVALALADHRPDLIRSLTLSCCTAEPESDPARFRTLENELRTMGGLEKARALTGLMFGDRFLEGSNVAALERWHYHFSSLGTRIADAVHGVFTRTSYESVLESLHLPVLLISGALDRAKSPSDMQRIADCIPGSRHIIFPDAGHTPAVESPEAYAHVLLDFINASGAKPTSLSPDDHNETKGAHKVTDMIDDDTRATSGSAYGEDAMPFADLQTEDRQDFIIDGSDVLLCGSRSRSSGSLAFPRRTMCQVTGTRDMEPITFGPRGVLYSFSTVHVSSSRKVPYTIGYVDFDNGLRVLVEVRKQALETLTCDTPVELKAEGPSWYAAPLTSNKGAA